jgi:SAM-dependent methyltransferase
LALADSSLIALESAGTVLAENAQRYQIDLMNLHMQEEWDVAFLLDVIEHLPDDRRALEQAKESLKPGGLLFVATPAFQRFWSYNDDLAHHLRRYTRADYARLARETGFTLLDARYFMFFLSPLYLLSRMQPGLDKLNEQEKKALVLKQHQIPAKPINTALSAIFAAETPIGHWLRFPWGTSVLGVFQKS